MDSDRILRLLQTFGGRDKSIRTAYFAIMFTAGRTSSKSLAERLTGMAQQFSKARLVARQFNDLPMIKANIAQYRVSCNGSYSDLISHNLQGLTNLLYLFYGPIEHIAYLAEHRLIKADSTRWFRYCLYIWASALAIGIVRSVRIYLQLVRERVELMKSQQEKAETLKRLRDSELNELLNIVAHVSDFMNAINFMPSGFGLWSQSFPQWKVGAFGFIASFAGLLKLYRLQA